MTFLMLANDYTDDASEHEEHEVTVNDENNEAHSLADVDGHENEDNHSAELAVASAKPFILKHEKPKLPSFHGDVETTSNTPSKTTVMPEIVLQYFVRVWDWSAPSS